MIINCIIYYDNFNEVASYIKELEKQTDAEKIIVGITVNKDSTKEAHLLSSNIVDLQIFYPNENLGYLNGLFYSYDSLVNMGFSSKWIAFSNTDIEFERQDVFEKLLEKDYDPKIFCVAPSILEKNRRTYENPQYLERYSLESINKRIKIFSKPKVANLYVRLSKVKAKLVKTKKQDSCFVYSAHGAYFFLNKKFLDKVSHKYMSLMYSEEAFIAEEVRLLGGKVYYDSDLEVLHNESQTTGNLGIKKKSLYIAESLTKIRDKYFIRMEK